MAYSETSEVSSQQLHGIALCQTDDDIFTKWQIELINSQVACKGCETSGYVLCTAAKAMVTQKVRAPVWRENQLLGKVTWVSMLSGMQYYATVGTKETAGMRSLNDVKWLTKELIEERSCSNQSLDVVESFCSKGEAAGSVVDDNAPSDLCPQLQRIISRCSCQLYFCHFPDSVDMDDDCGSLPPLPSDETDPFWQKKEYVDCFTLKHNTLNVSTNPLQYQMILDIVNNLLLYVDPKQKESAEKLMRYRFQLQLQSVDDLRPNILQLQEKFRQLRAKFEELFAKPPSTPPLPVPGRPVRITNSAITEKLVDGFERRERCVEGGSGSAIVERAVLLRRLVPKTEFSIVNPQNSTST